MTISPDSTVVLSLSNSDQIKARIADLQEMLQKQLPGYESLLHTIHRNLSMDPETTQLLSDEEIGVIVAGLSKRTGIFITKVETEKKLKKGGKITLDDL
jgi:hypothetical protein